MLTTTIVTAAPLRFAQIVNTPGQVVGAEILKAIYAKAGISIEIISVSGNRALLESNEGRLDGEIHRILEIGETYPNLIKVPTAINYLEATVFSKDKHFLVTDCNSLRGKLIGRVRGIKHAEMCTKDMSKVAIFSDSGILIKSLNNNIVDFAITSQLNGLVQLKKLGIDTVYPLEPTLSQNPLFHYLHKKHANLIPQIDNIIIKMAKSGELDLIRKQEINRILTETSS